MTDFLLGLMFGLLCARWARWEWVRTHKEIDDLFDRLDSSIESLLDIEVNR